MDFFVISANFTRCQESGSILGEAVSRAR